MQEFGRAPECCHWAPADDDNFPKLNCIKSNHFRGFYHTRVVRHTSISPQIPTISLYPGNVAVKEGSLVWYAVMYLKQTEFIFERYMKPFATPAMGVQASAFFSPFARFLRRFGPGTEASSREGAGGALPLTRLGGVFSVGAPFLGAPFALAFALALLVPLVFPPFSRFFLETLATLGLGLLQQMPHSIH